MTVQYKFLPLSSYILWNGKPYQYTEKGSLRTQAQETCVSVGTESAGNPRPCGLWQLGMLSLLLQLMASP